MKPKTKTMKKTLLIAAVAGLAFASCKKDYTCECTTSDSADPSYKITSSTTYKAKKKDAEASCNGLKTTVGTISTACSLK